MTFSAKLVLRRDFAGWHDCVIHKEVTTLARTRNKSANVIPFASQYLKGSSSIGRNLQRRVLHTAGFAKSKVLMSLSLLERIDIDSNHLKFPRPTRRNVGANMIPFALCFYVPSVQFR